MLNTPTLKFMKRVHCFDHPQKIPLPRFPLIWAIAIMVLGLFLLPRCSFAAKVPPLTDKNAILAIIGEAENQGPRGMLAIACGIRNRGTLRGVYGINAPRVKRHLYSKQTYTIAKIAWDNSSQKVCRDLIAGADHWENINAFGKPSWASNMIQTARIKDHVFYREELIP